MQLLNIHSAVSVSGKHDKNSGERETSSHPTSIKGYHTLYNIN